MRLLDQTKCSTFYVSMHGPRPSLDQRSPEYRSIDERLHAGDLSVLENEQWFPRARDVGDVEAPEGWTGDAWASLVAQDVDTSGAWLLGEVYAVSADPPLGGRGMPTRRRFLCVWNVRDGALVYGSKISHRDSDVLDARWAHDRLLLLSAGEAGRGEDYELRLLAPPDFHVSLRQSFDSASANTHLSAQRLTPLGAPTHWLVNLADAGGDAAFHAIVIEHAVVRRVYCIDAPGGGDPLVALSDDARWLAYRQVSLEASAQEFTLALVDLRTGEVTLHPIELGEDEVLSLSFEPDGTIRFDMGERAVIVAISFPR